MDDHSKALAPADVGRDSGRLAPVVAQVLAANPTPEVLAALLEVQREWEAGEAKKAYQRALVAMKRALPAVIAHDKAVDFTSRKTGDRTNYTHTSLAAVMDAVTGTLSDHGFSLTFEPATEANRVTVTTRLTHEAGHSEVCTISAPPDSSGLKGPAQSVMSTITYLSRYGALSLLGLATADMSEPHGPQPEAAAGDVVDMGENKKLAAKLRANDIPTTDAEALVGATWLDWTSADVARIRAWAAAVLAERKGAKP